MWVVRNYMEKIVWDKLDQLLNEVAVVCDYGKCRADIAARALNELKPAYATTRRGETLLKAASLDPQLSVDVVSVLSRAMEIVSRNPHHENSSEKI